MDESRCATCATGASLLALTAPPRPLVAVEESKMGTFTEAYGRGIGLLNVYT
jgi:hypothetical protein